MEDSLLLVFGAPLDYEEKKLFNSYQEARKSGEAHHNGDWQAYEEKVVERLFEHVGDSPSHFEELLRTLVESPIKITNYYFSMGFHRGLWVANVTISRADVLRGQGSSISWPPTEDFNKLILASLGCVLNRNWIGVFSLHSKVTPELATQEVDEVEAIVRKVQPNCSAEDLESFRQISNGLKALAYQKEHPMMLDASIVKHLNFVESEVMREVAQKERLARRRKLLMNVGWVAIAIVTILIIGLGS